jgi:hypothetical protein
MRAYHFVSATHALENVRQRRLKIATFTDLNDPFELWAVAQPDPTLRRGLRRWKKEIARNYGVLCFTTDWQNPVMWSHYADKHRGIALGFDISPTIVKEVRYRKTRPAFHTIDERTLHTLLYTKHKDWHYEREVRVFARFNNRDPTSKLFFGDFTPALVLREIITGPLCTTTKHAIQEALRGDNVVITKGRLAFNTFTVVKDQRGFRTTPRTKA